MPASRTATCPTCSAVVIDGDKFCAQCGSAVGGGPIICKTCNTPVVDGDKFCAQCGTPVSGVSASMLAGPGATRTPESHRTTGESAWDLVLGHLREMTIGEFEIGRELGRGGMAAVFLAHDVSLNRRVAIKVMAPGLMMGDDMIERFRREAITIANLQHANIVTVHAVRQRDNLHFFVMQFVEGRSLDEILRAQGKLPVNLVRPIVHQVGSALAYAHRRGVIHRDVKPGNILFSGDGDALVTDFGIAKVAESPTQTQTGMIVGTPMYMSPEQCMATDIDGASDQYSLGIVAYQMLAGRAPFTGGAFEIMKGHATEPVPPLRDFAPDVPEPVERAILRMLAKKPTERFASFSEALSAMGAQPLGENDTLRAEMIRLAAVEERLQALGELLRTPVSPVPRQRPGPPTPRTPAPKSSAAVIAVAIAPLSADLEAGDEITLRATVRGVSDASGLRWRTDDGAIIAIDPVSGLLRARAPGDATVVAQIGDVVERLNVRVVAPRVASLVVSPIDGEVCVGDRLDLTVQPMDRRGRPLEAPVVWSASGTAASVSANGQVHALAVGRAVLTASCAGVSETVVLHVQPAPVATLEIVEPDSDIEVGQAIAMRVIVQDASGTVLTDRPVQWGAEPADHARINAAGVLSAMAEGTVTVWAVCDEIESAIELEIVPARASTVSIVGLPAMPHEGDRFTLTATARDARGTPLSREILWRSSHPAFATISVDGTVNALAPGAVEFSATVGEAVATARVVIRPRAPELVVAAPAVTGTLADAGAARTNEYAEEHAGAAPARASVQPTLGPSTAKTESSTNRAKKPPYWLAAVAVVPIALVAWLLMKDGPAPVEAPTTNSPAVANGGAVQPREGAALPAPAPESAAGLVDSTAIPATGTPATGTAASGTAATAGSNAVLRLTPPTSTTLRVAESLVLRTTLRDQASGREVSGPVRFTSSDRRVALVNSRTGVVTAVAAGRAIITADGGGAGTQSITLSIVPANATVVANKADSAATKSPVEADVKPPVVDVPKPDVAEKPVTPVVTQAQLVADARSLVDSYARAMESRDLAKVRAVYPGMSSDFASSLSDLFKSASRVNVSIKSMAVTSDGGVLTSTVGARSSLRVAVSLDYTVMGKKGEDADTWLMILQRQDSGWRLVQLAKP